MDNEKLDLILKKLEALDRIEERLDRLEERMDRLEERMDRLEERMDKLEARTDELETGVRGIKLELENEIRKNISIVAEGHLDLVRKLDDITKPMNKLEMLEVQVNMLQSKVHDLERRLSA